MDGEKTKADGTASIVDMVREAVASPVAQAVSAQPSESGNRAAGVLFLTTDGDVLWLKRAADRHDHAGEWAFPAGHVEGDETLQACAAREAFEETGFQFDPAALVKLHDDGHFACFVAPVPGRFEVVLCPEHDGSLWSAEPPDGAVHPNALRCLEVLRADDELKVAKLIRDGILPSPQVYKNIFLQALRITGTGMAYRAERREGDKVISAEEYVWRDASLYLNPHFLERCAGLPVLLDHPEKAKLSAAEFEARVAGSIMFAYVVGDDVWGIARIYSADAIEELRRGECSTSPTVVLPNNQESVKVQLEGGTALLIEGKPVLLDHLAIVSSKSGGRGVWDKSGEPAGVKLDNQDIIMTDEDKAKADTAKAIADALASAKADSDKAIADACEKAVADAMAKRDAMEKEKADAAKADSDAKAVADAAKRDAEEKEKADEMPAMADVQGRSETVFAALGKPVPHPMAGERLTAYRRRLLTQLKVHSSSYKGVDLSPIADSAHLDTIERHVYADALAASRNPQDLGAGELREIRRRVGGRDISEFVGSFAAAFSPFMMQPLSLRVNTGVK